MLGGRKMTMQDKLEQARHEMKAGKPKTAVEILDELHVECHKEAVLHIKTHWALAKAHRQAGNYRRAAFELIAMPFAGPASLMHKHFGIARRNL